MIDRLTFRHAIAAHMGETLTPALCAAIEVEANTPLDRAIDPRRFAPATVRAGDEFYVLQVERIGAVLGELHTLHELHYQETELHRHGLAMDPDYGAMLRDDRLGRLLQFTVRNRSRLVGNLRVYIVTSRHTQTPMAVEDTLFIHPDHRQGLLGLKLIRYAIDAVRLIGVREFEADSKLVNGADVLMRRVGCKAVATKFHKFLE